MEGGDELLQCLEEKIASGHSMIERLKLMDKIDGIDKLIRRIQQEIKFLEKVQCMGNLKKEHLQSSNLTHLDAMVARLSCAKDPTSVMRPFKYQKSRLEIDIVCNSGASWVKVIARNAKALTLISLGNGEYGQKSILDQANSYLMCSKCHLYHYRPPDVIFNFAYGIEVPLALQLEQMGIIVEGDRIDTGENNLNGWPPELDALCEELDNERLQVIDQRRRNQDIAKPQIMDQRPRNQDIAKPQAMGDRIDTDEKNLNGWPPELDALCEELDNERLQIMDQRRRNQDIAKPQVMDQRHRNQDIANPQAMGIIVEGDRIDTGENNLNGWPPGLDALCKKLDNEKLQVMDQRRRNQDIAKPQVMGQRRCNQDIAKPQVMGQRRRNQPYWWSEEIASLRREAIKCRRAYTRSHRRRDPIYTAQCLDRLRPARQALRSAIRIAKTKAWVELLAIVILIACFFYFLEVVQDELDSSKESSNNSENDSDVNLRSLNTSVLSTEVRLLNLDVSTLLAYVTNMSNGYNNFVYREPLLTQQAEMERKRPIKPILENLFQDKELVICQTAYNNFMNIIHFIGGPKETQRAQELLNKVRIVDDVTTGRIMELRLGGKIKDRSRLIFATGESMKSITVSANQGFVRAARMQDIECTVFLHEPRSLSEIKQGNATNIKQS